MLKRLDESISCSYHEKEKIKILGNLQLVSAQELMSHQLFQSSVRPHILLVQTISPCVSHQMFPKEQPHVLFSKENRNDDQIGLVLHVTKMAYTSRVAPHSSSACLSLFSLLPL